MNRITIKNLEALINNLNKYTNNPLESYRRIDSSGRCVANIGNYHISQAYGGVCLHQMVNDGGGVRDVLGCGHVTKRDLYNRLQAYISGVQLIVSPE